MSQRKLIVDLYHDIMYVFLVQYCTAFFFSSCLFFQTKTQKIDMQSQGRGRHERRRQTIPTTTDEPILGSDIVVDAELQDLVDDTEQHEKSPKTSREYRNRISHIIKFIQEKYPGYYAIGVVELTEEQRARRNNYYYNNTHDLIYTGINVKVIKAFLASIKKKSNGKTCSHVQLRKYHNAIVHGAEKAGQTLPDSYVREMKKFLASFEKETRKAKNKDELDEQESDPIPFQLYRLICEWAILTGDLFVWLYTVTQWNCIARSINIDNIGFHNITPGSDSVKITYDDSKADKKGKHVTPKNIYANPFDPRVSWHVVIGCWLSTRQETFRHTEKIFQKVGAEDGSAASRYSKQLIELLKDKVDTVREFVRPKHCNPHGTRKGSAMHITTNTTDPPPLPSVAARGEWSIGKVLDLYFKFGDSGDCRCGRALAGLPTDSSSFSVMPPHFTVGLENCHVNEGINLCFGVVLEAHPEITWLCLLCLASIVHASDYLNAVKGLVPEHPFHGIPVLNNPTLLKELKALITLKPSEKMPVATGVPFSVKQMSVLEKLLKVCTDTLKKISDMTSDINASVKEAIDEATFNNGQISADRLSLLLDNYSDKMMTLVDSRLQQMSGVLTGGAADTTETGNLDLSPTLPNRTYCWGGKLYDVPKTFMLPRGLKLFSGWCLWVTGDAGAISQDKDGKTKKTPIKPFRLFTCASVPKSIYNSFKSSWMPIFKLMEEGDGVDIPSDSQNMTSRELKHLYDLGIEHVKKVASYIFDKYDKKNSDWNVSTWSTKVRRNAILKNGSQSDIAQLPPATRYNHTHTGTRKKRKQTFFPIRHNRRDITADNNTAADVLNTMLRESNPQNPGIVEQIEADLDAMLEAGRKDYSERLARAETGLSDGDSNRIGVRPPAASTGGLPSAREPGFIATVATATRAAVRPGYIPQDAPIGGDGAPDYCGQCGVDTGCTHSELRLRPHYKCKCGKCVHALCAMENNLRGEDNEVWCSMTCKLSRN